MTVEWHDLPKIRLLCGCAANKSACLLLCQYGSNTLRNVSSIKSMIQRIKAVLKVVQPFTSKVYLIRWPVIFLSEESC